ncbi:MAG TPA: MFS transporter, partial [Thermoleophilia bacterium]|nr:MFS transporter [Thermoleophilia bacterium]
LGRKSMMLVAAVSATIWFLGFAASHSVGPIVVLVAMEGMFGWPLFQTAANAMTADLLPLEKRAEAFAILRTAINVGVVAGPPIGGLALTLGASFRELFVAAAVGCGLFFLVVAVFLRETRPESARRPQDTRDAAGRSGWRLVLGDRRFLAFCGVAVLPVFCFGLFGAMYSIFITRFLHVPTSTWSLLLALNAAVVALLGYPMMRATRRVDRMVLLSISSVLIGVGLGGTAFAQPGWQLYALVVVLSLGEVLLGPVAAGVVSDLAPEAIRGRYNGAWTVVWNGGASLGPLYGGWAMDALGGRQTFGVVFVVALVGAGLFLLLRGRVVGSAVAPATSDSLAGEAES